jgi:hypothetical protein
MMAKKLLLSLSFLGTAFISLSQYCTSGGPTSTIDSNVESVELNGAIGSINYTGCPGVIGVEEVLAQSITLNAGSNYTISIQFGTCGGNFGGVGEAWIDFNLDNVFDPSESLGTWQGTPPSALSQFNFTVPLTATQGSTKMRVAQAENGTLPLNPCATYTWGSMMDFNIEIVGVDCSTYEGDTQDEAISITALPYLDNHNNSVCYTDQNPIYSSTDVYYEYEVQPADEGITASLCGSSFDTYLTVTDKYGNILNANDDDPSCGTSSECTVNVIGYDTVYVIVEGWGSLSGDYALNITTADLVTLNEIEANLALIFPNPSNGIIRVDSDQEIKSAVLLDIRGRQIQKINSTGVFDATHQPNGMYLVRIEFYNGQIETQKIIKK